MNALLAHRQSRICTPLGFGVVALLFYLIDGAIAHSAAFAPLRELMATAVSVDLTLGVTFAYSLMVVRPSFAAILYTAFFASIVEMVAVHFLLRATFPRVAVGVLALSVFGAFWLLGFTRSVQLRPILVTDAQLQLRIRLQWSLDVPLASIAALDVGRVKAPAKGTPGFLRATIGQPNVLIELREPMRARGPRATERQVSVIALTIDDAKGFRSVLQPTGGRTNSERQLPQLDMPGRLYTFHPDIRMK